MKRRNAQPINKAKSHRVYNGREVLNLYKISRNTLTNWKKAGLMPANPTGRDLFTGIELNEFHRRRALKRRRACEANEVLCFSCKCMHSIASVAWTSTPIDEQRVRLVIQCPDSGRMTARVINARFLAELTST